MELSLSVIPLAKRLSKVREHPDQMRWWADEVRLMRSLNESGLLVAYVHATRRHRAFDHAGDEIVPEVDPFWARFRRAQLIATNHLTGRP